MRRYEDKSCDRVHHEQEEEIEEVDQPEPQPAVRDVSDDVPGGQALDDDEERQQREDDAAKCALIQQMHLRSSSGSRRALL